MEPVLHHMLAFRVIQVRYSLGPFSTVLLHTSHHQQILLDCPLLVQLRINMIEPSLPALFTRFVRFHISSHKQLPRYLTPHPHSIVFLLNPQYLIQNLILLLAPLRPFSLFQKRVNVISNLLPRSMGGHVGQ